MYTRHTLAGKQEKKMHVVSLLGVPADTPEPADEQKPFPHISLKDDQLWVWHVGNQEWVLYVPTPVGFTPDTFTLSEDGSREIGENEIVERIIAKSDSSTPQTLKFGLTEGGNEVMFDKEFTEAKWDGIRIDLYPIIGGYLIYFTGVTEETTFKIYKRSL